MSLYFSYLFFITYYIIQIECNHTNLTCEQCLNNNLTCQSGYEYGCQYCCSFPYWIIWLVLVYVMPIALFIFIMCCSYFISTRSELCYSTCSLICFFPALCYSLICFIRELCNSLIRRVNQMTLPSTNRHVDQSLRHNNENNLPTFASDLQVNQIDQSLQQNDNNTPTCSICLENLNNNNQQIRTISCGHTFHQNCIDSWFNERPTNPCPYRCQLF
jgi:hypothetical protein